LRDDEFPISEVGEWAKEKHERLRKFVNISRYARQKYVDPAKSKLQGGAVGGATYIDLFSGPGRSRIRESGEIIDGSPVVAFRASVESGARFTEVHLGDLNPEFCKAACARVKAIGGNSFAYAGRATDTVSEVTASLRPEGLHFALLDPFNLEGLSFEVVRALSSMKHIDLLLHLSLQDLQRNLDRYVASEQSPLDVFAPGWRQHTDPKQGQRGFRAALLTYWQSLVRRLGFQHQRAGELVTGTGGQRLYWLIFLSRHSIANDFWDKIRNVGGQGELTL